MGMSFRLGTPWVKTLNVCVDDEFKNIGWTCFIDTYWSLTGSLLAGLPMAQNFIQIIANMIMCHICHMFFRTYIQLLSYISSWNHQEVHRFGLRSYDPKLRSTAMLHLQFMAHGKIGSSPLHSMLTWYNICLKYWKKPAKNEAKTSNFYWLVVSTHLKNISQIGNLPQIGVNIKKYLSCHHLVYNSQNESFKKWP